MIQRRRRRRKQSIISEVSLTPLMHTAVDAVDYFYDHAPMINQCGEGAIPKGTAQEAKGDQQEFWWFILMPQSRIFFNGDVALTQEQLFKKLVQKIGEETDETDLSA